jgi:hypothetical protein
MNKLVNEIVQLGSKIKEMTDLSLEIKYAERVYLVTATENRIGEKKLPISSDTLKSAMQTKIAILIDQLQEKLNARIRELQSEPTPNPDSSLVSHSN